MIQRIKRKNKIIIAANRLPVTVGNVIRKSSGGLVSALDGLFDGAEMLWVGWPGAYASNSKAAQNVKDNLVRNFNCYPIFLTRKEVSAYYHGFSNACLWPALHYFPHYVHYSSGYWDTYVKINKKFAEHIAANASDGDTVWVHDYHLFLVPQMLRSMNPSFKIGFFLHTPFPSFEIFRCLPHREEILKGLLGADLIGFHTYGYLRHFRSSLIRLLNIESDVDMILHGERFCRLGVFPIGINSRQFLNELETVKFQKRKKNLQSIYSGYKIVLGVERVDYTKGILRRFEAIEKFLANQKGRTNIVFIFIGVPTRGEVKEYQDLLDQIQKRVGEINSQYSNIGYAPVHFIHRSIPFSDLCALYSVADVAMVTPLIDGMNLVAKEYLACKTDSAGVLLLSEFTGAAQELFNAVQVNPYDIDNTARSLEVALEMSENEKMQRLRSMRNHVLKYDSRLWAETFLDELMQKKKSRNEKNTSSPSSVSDKILGRIIKSRRAVFFIDYDGTLKEFEDLPNKAFPDENILKMIRALSECPNYDVFIISGRKGFDLENWFGALNVTLIAEHGYNVRTSGSDVWKNIHSDIDLSWKNKVIKIFTQYALTTPGTFIEEKTTSIVWHFRKADPEFGKWKSQQLMSNLLEILANENVIVNQGKRIVEVSSSQINKGAAVRYFMQKNNYDLVICAGDDKTDETMFKINDSRMISIKIGPGETFAQHRLGSPALFREFLKKIIKGEKFKNG